MYMRLECRSACPWALFMRCCVAACLCLIVFPAVVLSASLVITPVPEDLRAFSQSHPGFRPVSVTLYGDDNYPPYSYIKDGKPAGLYVELLQGVLSHMPEYRVTIKMVPWRRGLNLLKHGDGFAIFPPYFLPKERPYIGPYSVPLFKEDVVAVCNRSLLASRTFEHWPHDYKRLKFSNNSGFRLGTQAFWKAVRSGEILIEESSGTASNLLKVVRGRVDCTINDRLALREVYRQLRRQNEIVETFDEKVFESKVIRSRFGHLGYAQDGSKFPFKSAFIARFNKVFFELQNAGDIDEISDDFAMHYSHGHIQLGELASPAR